MKFPFSLIRNRCVASAAVLLVSFNLSACSDKESNLNANPYRLEFADRESWYLPETSIPIHFNTNPKYVYEITLVIDGSPMPLIPYEKSVVSYDAPSCRYASSFLASLVYSLSPSTTLEIPIKRVNENTYKLLFVIDALLDEDYGLTDQWERQGVCHWETHMGPLVSLSPTGRKQEFNIGVDIFETSMLKNPPKEFSRVYYYEKRHVTTAPITEFSEDGTPMSASTGWGNTREELKNIKDEDLFTITVTGWLLTNR